MDVIAIPLSSIISCLKSCSPKQVTIEERVLSEKLHVKASASSEICQHQVGKLKAINYLYIFTGSLLGPFESNHPKILNMSLYCDSTAKRASLLLATL